MKKIVAIALTILSICVMSVFSVSADNSEITVLVNDKEIVFDVKPQIIDERTMVPVRGVFESLGAIIKWDNGTRTVYSTLGNRKVSIQIDNTTMIVNGKEKTIDVPAKIISDRTLVPVRAIAEALGCNVGWDHATRTVIIKSAKYAESIATKEQEKQEENDLNEQKEQETIDSKELACLTSISKSVMSVGGNYRIAFSVSVEGKGGEGNYKYRYELYQNGKIIKKCSYSKENTFEGNLTGIGECILKVYVKDNSGTEVSKDIDLTK